MGGSVTYRPNLQFDVSLQSKSVRLRYPDGLRAVLDGNLIFIGTTESSVVNGRVLVDSSLVHAGFRSRQIQRSVQR